MLKPEKPVNEFARLSALRNLNILDTEPEERFDRLTRMAKRMFAVPIALVSLVDADRQWFKSCFGLDASETDRDISFCGHAIRSPEVFVISNALEDDRFADNPLVTGDPYIRFYAGCPIRAPGGMFIGTLCVIDTVARIFNEDDVEMLKDLARMVESELTAVQMATIDELTGISNRRGFNMISEYSLALCLRHKRPATIALLDLNDFKPINDNYGHAEGDKVLKFFAESLKDFFRDSDLVARLGGDEFCILLISTGKKVAKEVFNKFINKFQLMNDASIEPYDVSFSIGLSFFDPDSPKSIDLLIKDADENMYIDKRNR